MTELRARWWLLLAKLTGWYANVAHEASKRCAARADALVRELTNRSI